MTQSGIPVNTRAPARWFAALKPQSWPKILVPTLLGQALGAAARSHFGIGPFVFGLLFALLDVGFIVLLNDCADEQVDRIKRTMFPSSSHKTLPDGILPVRSLRIAGSLSGFGLLSLAVAAGWLLHRPLLGPAALGALLVFAAYSLPPVQLNYRGGGELLEAIGVGLLLPWMNAYAQSGRVLHPAYAPLVGFTFLSLSSAVASGLADEESDRKGGKQTFVTARGNRAARRFAEGCAFVGILTWGLLGVAAPLREWMVLPAGAASLWHLRRVRVLSDAAITNAFDAQRKYKAALHRAIWDGALVVAAGRLVTVLIDR